MDIENKIGYYAVIPATILFNKDLKANEKLLYAIITILSNKEGYCFKCLFKQFIRCTTTYNIKMGFSFKRMRFCLFRHDKKWKRRDYSKKNLSKWYTLYDK